MYVACSRARAYLAVSSTKRASEGSTRSRISPWVTPLLLMLVRGWQFRE